MAVLHGLFRDRLKTSQKSAGASQSAKWTGPVQNLYWRDRVFEHSLSRNALEDPQMGDPGYKQFCPLAMAAETLCTRWTMVLLRELVAGTTRFNDLRRGVPKMSPTLLSQRLKELEAAGIIERKALRREKGIFEYHMKIGRAHV